MFDRIDRSDIFFYTNGVYSCFCTRALFTKIHFLFQLLLKVCCLCSENKNSDQKFGIHSNLGLHECWLELFLTFQYSILEMSIPVHVTLNIGITFTNEITSQWTIKIKYSTSINSHKMTPQLLLIGHFTVVCWLSKIRILKCRRSYESPGCIDKLIPRVTLRHNI